MFYRFGKNYPDELVPIPLHFFEKAEHASETELRVLLSLAPHLASGGLEEEEAIALLEESFAAEEVLAALAFWRGCGIFKSDAKRTVKRAPFKGTVTKSEPTPTEEPAVKKVIDADEAPFYSSADLAAAAQSQPDFKNLVSFAEQRLEKVMNTSELARLYSFLDYLKMPLDVVILVIEDCASRDKKSLRYITKVLTSFQDEGIDTYDKAEAYFVARKESASYEGKIKNLFGLTRKLTKSEEECITLWRTTFEFSDEMLNLAYEKTVNAAKNPTIKYMHKILENWHASGFTTPADVEGGASSPAAKAEKSYDVDDFFQSAVSKGRKKV